MPLTPKPKEERIKESITILKKMLELNVRPDDPAFVELKTRMSEWINTGYSWRGRIKFPLVSRIADVILPEGARGVANVDFRVMS